MSRNAPLGFYEFFAGGGMARLGLGAGWSCLYANDFDPVKAATYRAKQQVQSLTMTRPDMTAAGGSDPWRSVFTTK